MQSSIDKITDTVVALYEIATEIKASPLAPRVEALAAELNKISKEYHTELETTKKYDTSKIVIGL